MGKRKASKHSARVTAGRSRRLLAAVLCGALVFVASGSLMTSMTSATRLLISLAAALGVFVVLKLAQRRPVSKKAEAGAAVVEAPLVEAALEAPETTQDPDVIADLDADSDPALDGDAEVVAEGDDAPEAVAEVDDAPELHEEPAVIVAEQHEDDVISPLNEVWQQVLAEDPSEDLADEATLEDPSRELVEDRPANGHGDLVSAAALDVARAEAEQQSLQRIRATVRGIGVRTGDDPAAVDVLARVVAAVDRLMGPDEFARPALGETGPLLAEALPAYPQPPAAYAEQVPTDTISMPALPSMSTMSTTPAAPALSTMPAMPDVSAMQRMDDPATLPAAPGPTMPMTSFPDEATATAETQSWDVVEAPEPEVVLPIPASPPRATHAPRGRRLRRHPVS
jgi:hypothetical protein